MDQIKENPFLSAYTAVLIIGAGVLGFLCFKSYGDYKDAKADYDSVKSSVEGLKSKEPYPNAKNKKERTEEVARFTEQLLQLELLQLLLQLILRELLFLLLLLQLHLLFFLYI